MPCVNIRHLQNLSAIPRPIEATHKPRQYYQLRKSKPKDNLSRYNVLPAIDKKKHDKCFKNEKDLYDKEPTPFDEISDSEFLYDEMTAELEDMLEREAKLTLIREKAFVQYLELKSDYMDWVIKMPHNNVWVPVKGNSLSEMATYDQSSMKDNIKIQVPPVVNCKDTSFNKGTGKLVPKPPSYPKGQSPPSLNTEYVESEPPACVIAQPSTSVCRENIVLGPLACPKDKADANFNAEHVVSEPTNDCGSNFVSENQSPMSVSPYLHVPRPPTSRKIQPPIREDLESAKLLPTPPAYGRDRNSKTRKVRKPKIVTQQTIASSSLSPSSELPSPRIVLALI